MQITIDLSQIFCGDEEPCDLQDAIRKEVVESLTTTLKKGLERQINNKVAETIQGEIDMAVKEQMPRIVDDLMNLEYTSVDRYGSRGSPTTFRQELLKTINEQMQYKPQQYESGENVFTKAVRAVTQSRIKEFQAAFDRQVNATFIAEVHEYAVKALAKKLGLSA